MKKKYLSKLKNYIVTSNSIAEPKQTVISSRFVWLWTIVLTMISALSWIFYYQQGLILSYNDARSHLDVARRVVDNLQPGLAQLGSVWLPLFHILELPLVWNNFLWQSGLAGSLVSMIAYIVGGIFLLLLAKELSFPKSGIILSLLVYALNPNLVFMQAIPMTESLMLATTIGSVYYFAKWINTNRLNPLLLSGLFCLLATLTRYDGWFLLFFESLVVGIITLKRKGYKVAEGSLILFVVLAGLGVFFWFLWNFVIFHDPLYFATGPYSAKAQQDLLLSEGRLPTAHNLWYSIYIYLLAAKENVGIFISWISLFGIGVIYFSRKHFFALKVTMSLLLVPIIFNVASLYAGNSVINLPYVFPYTWFNDRYGLMMLPAAAIVSGFIGSRNKLLIVCMCFILFAQTSIMYINNDIITIQDGVRGASGNFLNDTGDWIHANARTGLILVASASNDALLFRSQLPLKRYIVEGSRKYWDTSMKNPTIYADWIIMHKGDVVYKNMAGNPLFLQNYKLIYRGQFAYIYKKDIHTKTPITVQDLPN